MLEEILEYQSINVDMVYFINNFFEKDYKNCNYLKLVVLWTLYFVKIVNLIYAYKSLFESKFTYIGGYYEIYYNRWDFA